MGLPDLIEIVPLERPVRAEITVPGSKSITNRALILAALAKGETTLQAALWSEDTQLMVEALRTLGFEIKVESDPREFCNRTITLQGLGGRIPKAGTPEKPLEIFVGNAGTAARFLSALVCLGNGTYRLSGVARMHERPQAALFSALRELGYSIDSSNDKLPAVIHGTGPRRGKCRVSIEESSQFASGLLLCAQLGGWEVELSGENPEESPYVSMTSELIKAFLCRENKFQVEPDASSGCYFIGAGSLEPISARKVNVEGPKERGFVFSAHYKPGVSIANWPHSGWQVDERFPALTCELLLSSESFEELYSAADTITVASFRNALPPLTKSPEGIIERAETAEENPPRTISRRRGLGDSIMMAIVLAPLAEERWRFTDLGRLRVQECERVVALRSELTKCGAKVIESGDTLEVFPSTLHGAEIETYNDHRMAMCFAILGLKVAGIKIKNPRCVKKTFPNFFQKLAVAPPHGLGVTILDGRKGRPLGIEDLFAE